MTVFSVPFATLPNTGRVRRPDLADPDCRLALAGFALEPDAAARRAAAEGWAGEAHDGANAELRADAETRLATLDRTAEVAGETIARQRAARAAAEPVKTVLTNAAVVSRSWLDTGYMWAGILMTMVLGFAEGKLVAQAVVTSGVFGLLPGSFWDEVFAAAFAAMPLGVGLRLRSRVALLAGARRTEAIARLNRRARALFYLWVALVALLLGPHLLDAAEVAADPFAERPAWGLATSAFLSESLTLLRQLSRIEIILLVGVSLVTASTVIGALLVNDREAHARARIEHVRDDETAAHCEARIDALLRDQLETDATGTGRLRGLLAAIEADRRDFQRSVAGQVEALHLRGDMARRRTILDHAEGGGQVIDAGPLFTRR